MIDWAASNYVCGAGVVGLVLVFNTSILVLKDLIVFVNYIIYRRINYIILSNVDEAVSN